MGDGEGGASNGEAPAANQLRLICTYILGRSIYWNIHYKTAHTRTSSERKVQVCDAIITSRNITSCGEGESVSAVAGI